MPVEKEADILTADGTINSPVFRPAKPVAARRGCSAPVEAKSGAGTTFTVAKGQDMAVMAAAGTVDLTGLDHRRHALDDVNDAISAVADSDSGFANIVGIP